MGLFFKWTADKTLLKQEVIVAGNTARIAITLLIRRNGWFRKTAFINDSEESANSHCFKNCKNETNCVQIEQ